MLCKGLTKPNFNPKKDNFLVMLHFTCIKFFTKSIKLEALERLYRSTGLIFLQWQKKFLTIIIQSLHFSSLKKKGMEKTCEKRRKMEKDKKMSFNIFYPFHGNFKD